jgi:hypothetical protein
MDEPEGYIVIYIYPATFSLARDILEKRVLATVPRVFLPGADIHVSIGFRAILGGPSSTPIPSGDLGDVFAKNEDVCVVKFGVFFTIRIVMLYGMMFAGRGALIFVPGPDEVGAVLGGGCDEGERGHYAIGGGDTYD